GGKAQPQGQRRADQQLAGRGRLVEQQPQAQQRRRQQEFVAAPHHWPPRVRTVSADNTASMYWAGWSSERAASSRYAETGPAPAARAMHSRISTATGPASLRRRRGVVRSSVLQKMRMPVRPNATMPASPETSTAATRIQASAGCVEQIGRAASRGREWSGE